MSRVLLEVCAGDIDSVVAAKLGGADRVELCSALACGGITPSIGLIRAAKGVEGIGVNVLIRPREGDFIYSPREADIILADIEAAREAGADGVVVGALTPEGDIDIPLTRRMIEAAGDMSVTFHRAFDLCRNPLEALDAVAALGCDRLLTSGQAQTAIAGAELLRSLVDMKTGVIIMAGGGVNPDNAAELVQSTGVSEIHASARAPFPSLMQWRREGVSMGAAGADEYSRLSTSADIVAAIIANINLKK